MADVWQLLLTDEYITEAELLISAAIGADAEPEVLTTELQRSSLKLVQLKDDPAAIADRLVRLVAAVTVISRLSLEQLATTLEWVKVDEDEDPDSDDVRSQMLRLLNEHVNAVREHLQGE